MTSSERQIHSRSAGEVASPVMRATFAWRWRRRKAACCSTRGFVGARRRTRPSPRCRTSAMTNRATTVLPMPVGRTTRVERSRQERAMFSW